MRGIGLLCFGLVVLVAAGPLDATQPVERPDPALPDAAYVSCDTDRGPTAYLPRLLRVLVNGSQTREEPVFLQRPCGALLGRVEDLHRLRIKTFGKPTVLINNEAYVNLNRYEDLVYVLDESRQMLILEGEPHIFFPTVVDFDPPPPPLAGMPPWGAFLNYGGFTFGSFDEGGGIVSANAGLGIFGPEGVLTSDWVASRFDDQQTVDRAGTVYTRDFVERIATFRAGDIRSRGGGFGSGAALGGIQYGTNFSTRPLMQISPRQMMEAATRRNATPFLFNNDPWDEQRGPRAAFMSSFSAVPYGPVELVNMPTYSNGEYELVLRDPFGGEQTVRQPFFFNQGLLRPGLEDFSYEAGWLRQGFIGENYGDGFASASYRRGLTNNFTIGGHLEGSGHGIAAGSTAAVSVPYWGVLSVTAAAAEHDKTPSTGTYGAIELENRYRQVAYALRQECQHPDFLLPTIVDVPVSWSACSSFASVSGSLPWNDTVGLTLASATSNGRDSRRSANLRYSTRPWFGAQLTGAVGWRDDNADPYSLALSFTYSFAALYRGRALPRNDSLLNPRRASLHLLASGSDSRLDSATARVTNSAPMAGGNASLALTGALTGPERESLSLGWTAPRLTASAGVQNNDGTRTYSAGASSGIVWMENEFFRSGVVQAGFALVRLGEGADGVRVNQVRTDEDGDAVVSPLLSYYPNLISVNSNDLPFNFRLDQTQFEAVPRFRSGLVLRPKSRQVRDAIVRVQVRDRGGVIVPLPLGAYATVEGSEAQFPVGEDGEVYLEGLRDTTKVVLHFDLQECQIEIEAPPSPSANAIPELGPFLCEGIQP